MKFSAVFILAAASLATAAKDEPCNDSRDCESRCIDERYRVVNIDGKYQFGCTEGIAQPIYVVKSCKKTKFIKEANYEFTEDFHGANICTSLSAQQCRSFTCALSPDRVDAFDAACKKEEAKSAIVRSNLTVKDLKIVKKDFYNSLVSLRSSSGLLGCWLDESSLDNII